MKLQSTLKLRPDFLFVAPLLNVVLLLLIFFLVTSSLVVQGGFRVQLPESASTLRPLERAHVLTVTAQRAVPAAGSSAPATVDQDAGNGDEAAPPVVDFEPVLYFNKEKVTMGELPAKLEAGRSVSRHVIISADVLVSHGRVVALQDLIWAAGCQPAIATSLAP
jgi:biopolymer transport protein ExbD